MMTHADETDDSHNESRSHPGLRGIPAALAAGEAYGIDGTVLLRAVTLGYDIGHARGDGDGRRRLQLRKQAWRRTASAGTFARRRRPACAAGLDTRQIRWALDYTAQESRELPPGGATQITSKKPSCSPACRRAMA